MKGIINLYHNFGGILGILKTIIFNLRYFPLKTALRFPVWLSSKARFSCMKKGSIVFAGNPIRGCIRIGVHDHKFLNKQSILLYVSGKLRVNGKSQITISSGSFVGIGVDSMLDFEGFAIIGGECRIVCHHHIAVGSECMIQERCIIMDHDTFEIADMHNECINPPQEISIGRNVWIQPGSIIRPGVSLPDNTIVSAGSIVTNIDLEKCKCGSSQSVEVVMGNASVNCISGRKTWNVNFRPYLG